MLKKKPTVAQVSYGGQAALGWGGGVRGSGDDFEDATEAEKKVSSSVIYGSWVCARCSTQEYVKTYRYRHHEDLPSGSRSTFNFDGELTFLLDP